MKTASILAAILLPATATGCTSIRPGPWYPAPDEDRSTLVTQHGVVADGVDMLRRDVSVYVLVFPAGTGYAEWGVRREDGSVEIVAPATSVSRQQEEARGASGSSEAQRR